MWGFRNKQKLFAAADGTIIPITQVNDPVFAQKMMGDGYGILPTSDAVYAPLAGVITAIFPTKHAISIKTKRGLDVLVHLGLDTVELAGKPFDLKVEVATEVSETTQLGLMNREMIHQANKETTIVVAFTQMELLNKIPEISQQTVKHGELLGNLIYQ